MHRRAIVGSLIAELKICSSSRNLQRGKRVHEAAIRSGDCSHVCVSNTLIDMYGKCGVLEEARNVFDGMHYRTVVSWNALILGYADNGEAETALSLFSSMLEGSCEPDVRTFHIALKACTDLVLNEGINEPGSAVHLLACRNGCDSDTYVGNALVNLYVKCGRIHLAKTVFETMASRTVVSWTALIMGYAESGKSEAALFLFSRMGLECCAPDARSYVFALKACASLASKEEELVKIRQQGKALHALALNSGCDTDTYVKNTLVDMYAKLKNMEDAQRVFDRMRDRDVVSWTNLILGYAENGEGDMALHFLSRMESEGCPPDARTFVAAIKACANLAEEEKFSVEQGRALHLLVVIHCSDNNYVQNSLLDMYGKCRSMVDAHGVFDSMKHRDIVSCTALVLGYAENGQGDLGLQLFSQMDCADTVTFVAALKACTDLALSARNSKLLKAAEERGKALHAMLTFGGFDSDMYVASTLVDNYVKCKCLDDARKVFDRMSCRDIVSWTALILGYAENGGAEEALALFQRMSAKGCPLPISQIFVAVLKACIDLYGNGKLEAEELKERGKATHLMGCSAGWDSNIYLRNILVDMYAKCRSMPEARKVFESMDNRDVVCWTALMLGYADNGEACLVLELYPRMKREGCEPDALTFVPVLKACGMTGASEFGKAVHAEICELDLENDAVVSTALVNFYARTGSLLEAKLMFDAHDIRDLVAWNALMTGYSRHGDTSSVFEMLERMIEIGLKPNGLTFVLALTACSHAGLVNKGKEYLEAMTTKHEVSPAVEHYICVIDLLGRANKLDEAMVFLRSMVLAPDAVTWTTVLGACRKWKNVELARLAFESVVSLDEGKIGGAYALMGSIWKDQQT